MRVMGERKTKEEERRKRKRAVGKEEGTGRREKGMKKGN